MLTRKAIMTLVIPGPLIGAEDDMSKITPVMIDAVRQVILNRIPSDDIAPQAERPRSPAARERHATKATGIKMVEDHKKKAVLAVWRIVLETLLNRWKMFIRVFPRL